MLKIVQLEDYVSNFDNLIDASFWSSAGDFKAYLRTAPGEVVERAKGADALLINKTVINAGVLKELPELKYLGVLATGYNVVDCACARERDRSAQSAVAKWLKMPSVTRPGSFAISAHRSAASSGAGKPRRLMPVSTARWKGAETWAATAAWLKARASS